MTLITSSAIETYIQRVTELSQSSKRIPTPAELEKIVTDLGITPEEIAKAEQESQDHYTRAQGYLRLKYWDDAILELQEAIAFNPSCTAMMLASAQAYFGRWQQHHKKEDVTQFHWQVRQCLEIQPDCEEALNLLEKFQEMRGEYHQRFIYGGVFLAAVVLGIIGFLFSQQQLPYVLQKQSDLALLQKEIKALRQEQLNLRQDLNYLEQNQRAKSEREIELLKLKISNLEKSLQELQKNLSLITIPLLPPSSQQDNP
jgi:tetratricopeptide (TPR) repeat protein